jgi:hypothetical protein
MAEKDSNKFAPLPPNITIRTMQSDLEALRTGGGLVEQAPPAVEQPLPEIPADAFLYQQAPQVEQEVAPAPPPIEPPPMETPVVEKPPELAISQPPTPPPQIPEKEEKKTWPRVIITIGFALGLIGLATAGYFKFYPRIAKNLITKPFAPTPLPASPSPELLVSPSPVSPAIELAVLPKSSTTVMLPEKSAAGLRTTLIQLTPIKEQPQSLKTLTILGPDNRQLTPAEFAGILIRNPLPSFTASIGEKYLPFFYFDKSGEARFGVAFAIQSGAKEDLAEFLKSWEQATIDQDFAMIFLGLETGSRKQNFQAATSGEAVFREVTYEKNNLSLIYGFLTDTLIITSSREAFLTLIKHLK